MVSYLEAKQNYAKAIQENSGGVFNKGRRLVSIPPFSEPFAPGTYILKSDFRPLSRSCVPKQPPEFELPDPPVIRSSTTFNFSATPSEFLIKALNAEAKASIKKNEIAFLQFTDLKARTLSVSELIEVVAFDARCRNSLFRFKGAEVLVIDAIIIGREIISSTKGLSVSAKISHEKVASMDMSYDDSGGYELHDKKRQPKFWVIAQERLTIEHDTHPAGKEVLFINVEFDSTPPSESVVEVLRNSQKLTASDELPQQP